MPSSIKIRHYFTTLCSSTTNSFSYPEVSLQQSIVESVEPSVIV